MAGGKETPRQKMIGMMYLVLTALLAMNVSKEVVNAFVTIDQGQRKTKEAVQNKIAGQREALKTKANANEQKYGPARDAANRIGEKSAELIKHIDLIKAKTFGISIGIPIIEPISAEVYENGVFKIGLDSVKALVGIDNYDNNTNLMVGDAANPIIEDNPDGTNYTATVLRDKLLAFKDLMKNELGSIKDADEDIVRSLNQNLDKTFDYPSMEEAKENGGTEGWVVKNFYHVPLAASTAMLTTLQSQILGVESELVDQLYTAVEGKSYKFDSLVDAVIPQATTVSQGASYEADVFLAAYDTKNPPKIYLGNSSSARWDSVKQEFKGESTLLEMDGTKGKVKIPSGGLGEQHREGYILFEPPGLPPKKVGFNLDYTVVAPALVVSADKMNVFYKGLDNPVTVSVPGYNDSDVRASMTGGSLSGSSGKYVAKVSSGTDAKISASVTLPDGSTKSMGPVTFRIKRVPDPVASFKGKRPSDNVIKGIDVKNAKGLRAAMDNFDFEYTPVVTSFKVVTVVNGEIREVVCQGNTLSAGAKGLLGGMRRGQKFSLEEIMVKMPEGPRKIGSISLKII